MKSSSVSQHQVEAEVNIVVDEYQDPQVQEQGEYLDHQKSVSKIDTRT